MTSHLVAAVEEEAVLTDDDLDDFLQVLRHHVHGLEAVEARSQDGGPPADGQVLHAHLVDVTLLRDPASMNFT